MSDHKVNVCPKGFCDVCLVYHSREDVYAAAPVEPPVLSRAAIEKAKNDIEEAFSEYGGSGLRDEVMSILESLRRFGWIPLHLSGEELDRLRAEITRLESPISAPKESE